MSPATNPPPSVGQPNAPAGTGRSDETPGPDRPSRVDPDPPNRRIPGVGQRQADDDRARTPRGVTRTAGSFLVTYGALRVLRVLQEKGHVPGGDGLQIKGWHVHHYVWGIALVAAQAVTGLATQIPPDARRRTVPLGAGLSLIADEFDLLTGQQHTEAAQTRRPVVDIAVLVTAGLITAVGGQQRSTRNDRGSQGDG